jgi:hypothetical protein
MATPGNGRLTVDLYAAYMTYQAAGDERRKQMNTTIRGQSLRVRAAMALLAVLLLVAVGFAVWPAVTASNPGGNPAIQAKKVDGTGGSSLRQDLIDQHLKIVERQDDGSRR